ncbi:hypothetical protein [Aquimixticola soesokkakensis]|nr:hypothetical protein [Aquimixticola soesokkakensis]
MRDRGVTVAGLLAALSLAFVIGLHQPRMARVDIETTLYGVALEAMEICGHGAGGEETPRDCAACVLASHAVLPAHLHATRPRAPLYRIALRPAPKSQQAHRHPARYFARAPPIGTGLITA